MKASPRLITALGAAAAAIVVMAVPTLEGRKYVPYRDSGGVWTVCSGVTGPAVIPGHTYSPQECDELESGALVKHAEAIAKCLPRDAKQGQKAAAVLLGYNIGVAGVCRSTFVAKLNAHDPTACAAIERFRFVAGKDCAIAANKCRGIVSRRAYERAVCEGPE